MTIKTLATVALASTLFVGALAGEVAAGAAIGEGVTAPFDGHTPREEWGVAPMDEHTMRSADGRAARAERAIEHALPNAAYFVVDLRYCSLATAPNAGPMQAGDEAIVYEDVFMGEYGGNCDTFYTNEVRPRVYVSDEQS